MPDYPDWRYVATPVGAGGEDILTELQEKLEAADLNLDAEKDLQVDVKSSALPTGAATESTLSTRASETTLSSIDGKVATAAKQDTMITHLDTIDDLANALASVGTDNLRVRECGWAYKVAIYNVTMTDANTEYSQALPALTRSFLIRCRGDYDIKLAFAPGQSGTTYLTIPAGCCYYENVIRTPSDPATTLYFQCPAAGQVAEIVAWYLE